MPAVLAQVKQALGTDAVILHTRAFKRGGFLGFGAKMIVEVTAATGSNIGRGPRQQRPTPVAQRSATSRNESRAPGPSDSMMAGDLIRRTYLAAQAELKQSSPGGSSTATLAAPAPRPAAPIAPAPRQPAPIMRPRVNTSSDLADEVRVVKRMVAKMVRSQREHVAVRGKGKASPAALAPDMPDKLYDQYVSLLQQEVADELAEEVMQQVRAALKPEELEDEARVKKAVFQAISKLVPLDAAASDAVRPADGRPMTIALIGPTGVGKTTTIAKLAANFKLREKKKVGLITIDTYRIAAVDQLRTYANIIGVPLHVISNPADMAEALRQCEKCDVVLIDTAGRSQRDDPKLDQLNQYIIAADPHEVHLVLSSTCTQSAMFDVIERFSQVRVDRIIFTKLDEAVTFGVLFNVARKVNKRLSYLTTGQEVPHQIEVGRSNRLAALVLGEGL